MFEPTRAHALQHRWPVAIAAGIGYAAMFWGSAGGALALTLLTAEESTGPEFNWVGFQQMVLTFVLLLLVGHAGWVAVVRRARPTRHPWRLGTVVFLLAGVVAPWVAVVDGGIVGWVAANVIVAGGIVFWLCSRPISVGQHAEVPRRE